MVKPEKTLGGNWADIVESNRDQELDDGFYKTILFPEKSSTEETRPDSLTPPENPPQTPDTEGDLDINLHEMMSPNKSDTEQTRPDSPTPSENPFQISEVDIPSQSDSENSEEDLPSVDSQDKPDQNNLGRLMSQREDLKEELEHLEKEIAEELALIQEYEQAADQAREDWRTAEKNIELERNMRQERRKEMRDLEEKIKNLEEFLQGDMEPSYSEEEKAALEEIEMVSKQLLEMNNQNVELENQIGKQKQKRENLEFQLAEMIFLSNCAPKKVNNQAESTVCAPQQNASTQTESETVSSSNKGKKSFSGAPQMSLFTVGAAPAKLNQRGTKNRTIHRKH